MMKLNSHGAGGAKIHIVKIYCKVFAGDGGITEPGIKKLEIVM